MRVTVSTFDDRLVNVEIDQNESLSTFKAILEAETGVPSGQQVLYLGGKVLVSGPSDTKTLADLGLADDDVVTLEKVLPEGGGQRSSVAAPRMNADGSCENPEQLMALLSQDPVGLQRLPPSIRESIESNNVEGFQKALIELTAARKKAAEEEARFMRLAAEDPMNPEVQAKLEEAIQQKNIAENFENAIEHNPEAFASVVMLYVNMEVNGSPLKAFVDSGAQMTIMSKSCAEKCGILRLMDTRFRGTAVGVGKAEILGRVHMAPLKAGGEHIPVSITVLDQEGMDFLFGLDNLKRHQCNIDLQANCLRFPALKIELPFLSEHEIPKNIFTEAQQQAQAEQSAQPVPPPQQQRQQQQQSTQPAVPQQQEFSSEKINVLMQLGFPREKCIAALRAAGGNEEMAASLLFSM
ncbi:hypothetical protein M9434_004665 [Picochlorum sp. BPE23]|nr:hypothetical protein M9434_004665 [Picochlorum sp. BPE23]